MTNESVHDRIAQLTAELVYLEQLLTVRPSQFDSISDFVDDYNLIESDARLLAGSLAARSQKLIKRIEDWKAVNDL